MSGYSEPQLLAEVSRLKAKLGYSPSSTDMRKYGRHSLGPYYDSWSDWEAVLSAADGVTATSAEARRQERLKADLTELTHNIEHPPRRADIASHAEHHPDTFTSAFGSLEAACRAANIPTYNIGNTVTKESLLEELTQMADTLGYTPNTTDVAERGTHSLDTYLRRWDPFDNAVAAAGLEPLPSDGRLRKAELLSELTRLHDIFNKPPAQWDMRFHGKHSVAPYNRAFDSWVDALRAAGISDPQYRISTEELKQDLRSVATTTDGQVTYTAVETHATHAPSTFYSRFGDLASARAAAGIE
jgi:hypothetical protein